MQYFLPIPFLPEMCESSKMWQGNVYFFPVLNLSCGSPWPKQLGREHCSRQPLMPSALHALGREQDSVPSMTHVIYSS